MPSAFAGADTRKSGVCDAIHLRRDVPAASTMIRCEDKVGPMLKYVAKRAIKINLKEK